MLGALKECRRVDADADASAIAAAVVVALGGVSGTFVERGIAD